MPETSSIAVSRGEAPTDIDSVYRQEGPKLIGLATVLVRDRRRAEELVHDAFVKAIPNAVSVNDLVSYMRQSVVNLCRTEWRNTATRKRIDEANPRAAAHAPAAEVEAIENSLRANLREAVHQLADRQREIVTCRYLLDYSTEETAVALGISEGAVKSSLSAALNKLQTLMAGTV
ncbi:MAG: sigma-70 family RNA polymerase sigma factor [Acidimicrobiia bacterium]